MYTITSSQFIKDSETISSNDDAFKFGFFSPANTTNRYVGIWYLEETNIIWVANREKPLQDFSGIVTISDDNTNLLVLNGHKNVIWSSNVSNFASNSNVTTHLQNTGNLVLLEDATGKTIWESFEHPTNTFLPNMILSTNQKTGSWKTPSNPAIGNFFFSLEHLNAPEFFVWNKTKPYWRSGPWNGQIFIGLPSRSVYTSSYLNGFNIAREDNGSLVEITYTLINSSYFGTMVLTYEGKMVFTLWINRYQVSKSIAQQNECDVYGYCGPNGSCDFKDSAPICTCLKGFEPKNADEWNKQNWTSGCVRSALLRCELGGEGDGFVKLEMTKVPDFVQQSYLSVDACRNQCLNDCNCTAYGFDDGIQCLTWSARRKETKSLMLNTRQIHPESKNANVKQVKIEDLPLFEFHRISNATNNFSPSNKIGQGGFGSVYKGELLGGLEIAVKRLSRTSGQGIEEFMNEVIVISKLQHRNLVRLLGCCIEGEEKMLVYEYMPNNSLDYYLFEYVMGGLFSEKSDVFSFGVLLLEIISGRKNTSFHNHEEALSLLGYAWKLWNEEEIVTLIDPEICTPDYVEQILRCIHIGLLCVQEIAKERPTMATVVSMLNSEIVQFPRPFQPAFIQRYTERREDIDQQCHHLNSLNNVTVTSLQGR
ncbi:hypothetical protein TSUD_387760 [Trifolium subterraneum]|uniref:non-specific serine/threonine protein kinase n=1 Tax=Trifolium subterraneum TaxID=3900 RepID=A0A2Z6MVE1_TRISU|nr:hypothetical protein TSUD_387760 [Trifolium subterraneum]